ncbi:MAG: hypothetical protein WBL93_10865 [Lutisporaceae bacterium]
MMENIKSSLHVDRDRILISNPEKYERIEIRNLTYDDGEGLHGGYNGNVIVGYYADSKDVFFLSANNIEEDDFNSVCDKIENMFGQNQQLVNLMIYNGNSTIYNLNEEYNN